MLNNYLRLMLLLATTAGLVRAQQVVTMPQSPVSGNPVNLAIQALYSYTGIYALRFIIGTPVGATYQGTCYIQMSGPTTVILYDTESGNLEVAGMGALGTAATLTSARCSVNLGASSLSGNLYSLRISSTAPNGTSLPVFAQYMVGYCQENCETFATLGSWTVQAGTPPPVQPAVLTSPTPSSTLPGAGATFAWTAGSGVSNYALQVGTYPGANNIANQSTAALSLNVLGLPTNGATVYVRLASWDGTQWLPPNSYTFTANTPLVPVQIISPVPGSIITNPSPTIQVSSGVNVGGTWLQTGREAGSGEAYEYISSGKDINIPFVQLAGGQVFATVNSAFQGGWLAQSVVYGTPAGGAPTARAARVIAPVAGAVLSNYVTIQWDAGVSVSKVRFTAGTQAGWNNLADQEYYVGSYSAALVVPATGNRVFITLWSLIGNGWLANTYFYDTYNQNANVTATTAPAQLLAPAAPIASSTHTFQWTSGTGANLYWLAVGSTVDGTDYYNERNIGTTTLSATVRNLPARNTTVYVTLYSRINNAWVPQRSTIAILDRPGQIPQSFRDCIAANGASLGYGNVCTLSEGTYYMWNTTTTKTIPGPAGNTTLYLNAPLEIARSGITVRGAQPQPRLVRHDPAAVLIAVPPGQPIPPTPGCQRMMDVAVGVSNLIIEKFEFEGSAGAYSGRCRSFTLPGDPLAQPFVQDLFFLGQHNNVTVRDSEFRNAVGAALVIYDPPPNTATATNGVTISGNLFVEPNLVGIQIGKNGMWNGPSATQECDSMVQAPPPAPPGTMVLAASLGKVPSNISISGNFFLRSWTGSLALNNSRLVTIHSNVFEDNYERPYDLSGGTMNTTSCDYDTKILANTFTGWGLTGANYTQALELHGHQELVQGNTIRGYPYDAIIARSINGLVVDNNILEANSRLGDESGINIWNHGDLRRTTGVTIKNNAFVNPTPASSGKGLLYGVRIGRHTCDDPAPPPYLTVTECEFATSANLSQINGVQQINNYFIGMRIGSYCAASGAIGMGWQPPSWIQCN